MFQREFTVGGLATHFHFQTMLDIGDQFFGTHGLTGLATTDFDGVVTWLGPFEIVIESDDTVNVGVGLIKSGGQLGDSRIVHIPKVMLQCMQSRQQSAPDGFELVYNRIRAITVPGSVFGQSFYHPYF
jgi:hypothetical protein